MFGDPFRTNTKALNSTILTRRPFFTSLLLILLLLLLFHSCRLVLVIIITCTVVAKQKIHNIIFFRAMWSRVCCVWESRKTWESISFTAVLPHNVCVRIRHGNTVAGKNLDPRSVPARVCAHEGEVVGGPVPSRRYYLLRSICRLAWPSVYCMRSFTLSALSLSLSLVYQLPTLPLAISLSPLRLTSYYSENILPSGIICIYIYIYKICTNYILYAYLKHTSYI